MNKSLLFSTIYLPSKFVNQSFITQFEPKISKQHKAVGKTTPNSDSNGLYTNICDAIKTKSYEKLNTLLKKVSNINDLGIPDELTLPALAISSNDPKALEILLNNGIDPNTREYFKPSKSFSRENLLKAFDVADDKLDAEINSMILDGFDISNTNSWNSPLINIAIEKGNPLIVDALIRKNATLDRSSEDVFIECPINIAADLGKSNILKKLLSNHEYSEPDLKFALLNAIQKRDESCVKILLSKEAGVYLSLESGSTMISETVISNNQIITSRILSQLKKELTLVKSDIAYAYSALKETEAQIPNAKDKNAAKKAAKREALEYMCRKDLFSSYVEQINSAICIAYKTNLPSSLIVNLLEVRDFKDYTSENAKKPATFVDEEINKLKREGYYRKTPNMPLPLFLTHNKDNLLDSDPINTNVRYSPVELLKKSTYLEDINNDRETVNKIYSSYNNTKEASLSALLTINSLQAFNKEHPINIIAAKSSSGCISHLTYGESTINPALGMCIPQSQRILFSSLSLEDQASLYLVHEMTHNAMRKVYENTPLNKYHEIQQSLNKSVLELRNHVRNTKSSDSSFKMIKDMLSRIDDCSVEYSFKKYINEDILCDVFSFIYHAEQNPETTKAMHQHLTPFLDFINKNIVPEMIKFVNEHPNRKNIRVPNCLLELPSPQIGNLNKPNRVLEYAI